MYKEQISKKYASEIWDYDKERLQYLKEAHNIDVMVVWESEYNKNKLKTIEKCLEFINGI